MGLEEGPARNQEDPWLSRSRLHRLLPATGKRLGRATWKVSISLHWGMMGRGEGAERSRQRPWQDLTLIRGMCRKFHMHGVKRL